MFLNTWEPTRRQKEDEIICYIEKYEPARDGQPALILFDFLSSDDLLKFYSRINSDATEATSKMMLLAGYNLKKVSEGSYYILLISELDKILETSSSFNLEEFSLVVHSLLLLPDNQTSFFKSSVSPVKLNIELDSSSNDYFNHFISNLIDDKLPGKLVVKIRDVGQGSWNEIYSNDKLSIIYDMGTHWCTSKAGIAKYIGTKEFDIQCDKPGLIISHWDIDHYHFLLSLDDATIKSFKYFIYRDVKPATTRDAIISKFSRLLSGKAYPLPPLSGSKRGYVPLKCINKLSTTHTNSKRVLLYNSGYHKDKNRSGLSLAIKTSKANVILPGDHFYKQISDDILPDLDYHSEHYLVVPHHGGRSGKYKYNMKKHKPAQAVVSVSGKHYGHPFSDIIDALNKSGFKVRQTNHHGEVTIYL